MIQVTNGLIRLDTLHTSYLFHITSHGHPEQIYYGGRVPEGEIASLMDKHTAITGSCIEYPGQDETEVTYCLDDIRLEWSGIGRGDYRTPPSELLMPDGTFTADFQYVAHAVQPGYLPPETLPCAYGAETDCDTLTLELWDASNDVHLFLYYTVYPDADVITRRAVLENRNEAPLTIRRIMSMQLDLHNNGDSLITLDGGWIKEAHRHDRKLQYGAYTCGCTTGASGARNNPGFLIAEAHASEDYGNVYGFNLVYSGNHQALAEVSPNDLLRIQTGIHPQGFSWTLQKGERFETPEAVLTFSDKGFNGVSAHFHDFVNNHIVRGDWKGRERPILTNNWESCFFQFSRTKLLRLARQAKKLGIELFVLDDGWFGDRNNDKAGLGDYNVNLKKLPGGMRALSDRIHRMGMLFGLWFEPEMVNPDSDLYRAHPEYAVTTPGKVPAMGRNQLVLDLCNPAVRDYIVEQVGGMLDTARIDYVKWDMNRHISDACSPMLSEQGRFYHSYILGLYDVLTRVFRPRPHILFESCSSGGNRFDLGMLCFSPQVWASDDTDPIERLDIQQGLSYLYPLSTMGAHVSDAPHQQTLRQTPLSTRFQVAAFGCLGYEMDLNLLGRMDKKAIRQQIAYYKAHRRTLQYGRFTRAEMQRENQRVWQCVSGDGTDSVAAFFQGLSHAAIGNDVLPLTGLQPNGVYRMETRPRQLPILPFGGLLKHIFPITLKPDGFLLRTANKFYALTDAVETYRAPGAQLMKGVRLNSPFLGTGYNKNIRMTGDFGSNLYTIQMEDEKK